MRIYSGLVTRRSIDIDDQLLDRALAAARAGTLEATVEIALTRLIARDAALRHGAGSRPKGARGLPPLDETDAIEPARSPASTPCSPGWPRTGMPRRRP
jgi:Arc/MetJ family transcription regulator